MQFLGLKLDLRAPFLAILTLLIALSFTLTAAIAEEVIKDFKSDIWINPDASLTVRENITVRSEGNQIKRGIFRDFPTDYKDGHGNNVRVGFTLEKVKRDGQDEPYHIKQRSNGVRIYIGDKDVFLTPGTYTYSLTYKTTRQLGFFDDFDELYWNVTGNGWAFPIEQASGRVHLPSGASILSSAAYTGYQGDQGKLVSSKDYSDGIEFYTTSTLAPNQGLTIAVSWPVGFVSRPTEMDKVTGFLGDNRMFTIGFVGLILLLVYYIVIWSKVGRDPAAGTVIPLFEPPKGYSPAAMRYIRKMGFDNKAFSAAIISMAVKGFLIIEETSKGEYRLKKTGAGRDLSPGERAVGNALFGAGRTSIDLEQKNHKTLRKAKDGLKSWLRTEFEKIYFNKNTKYFFPGVGISFLVIAAMIIGAREPVPAFFIAVWLTIWTGALYFLFRKVWRAWQAALGGGVTSKVAAIFNTVFALPFAIGEFVGLTMLIELTSVSAALIFVILQVVNATFYHLLKAPTHLGRKMLDAFEGFSEFLSVAEKDRMNFNNPPDRTPELFEKYLPFALALGVEQAWGEQFAGRLGQATTGPENTSYHPAWYHGRHFDPDRIGSFSSSLGQGFSSAISSASTAPGSSSGSSGGGSSGGGGGGGGGGGW
ncbi:MAG: DUF2207 domain-containing protein [Proteobacteria bacterium]|nr:DUF2207 domain-containing protein [Pseudomonadota bacterium]